MRHRSPRPLLDRLLSRPAHVTLRRGALAACAVTALGTATGFTLSSLEEPTGSGRPVVSADSPADQATPVSTPTRDDRPSRSAERKADRTASPSPSPTEKPTEPAPELPTDAPTPELPDTEVPEPSESSEPPSSPSPSEPRDEDPPETSAVTEAAADAVWTVTSTADEAATFACNLDGTGWEPCPPTTSLSSLDLGRHTLLVRATDEAGNTDPSPAELDLKVTGAILH